MIMSGDKTLALAELAARSGDWASLSKLWDADQKDGARPEKWSRILAQCAQIGQDECCKELASKMMGEWRQSALLGDALLADAKRGFWKTCRELLGEGADASGAASEALIEAARGGWEKAGQELLEHGADPCAQNNAALKHAAKKGLGGLVRSLARHGAELNANQGEPLVLASRAGAVEAVLALLEEGAFAAHGDSLALREAAKAGHATACHLLVEFGAKIGAKNNEALRLAVQEGKEKTIATLLRDGANWDDKPAGGWAQTTREWAFDPGNEDERGAIFIRKLSDCEWDKDLFHRLVGGVPRLPELRQPTPACAFVAPKPRAGMRM